MKVVVAAMVVMVCVLAVHVGTVGAVAADETGLGFDQYGQKIVGTSRNVIVPIVVTLGVLALGVTIVFVGRAAGMAVRLVVGLAVLVIAVTGVGLATLFPGLITTLTLP